LRTDGTAILMGYDTAGRLSTVTTPTRQVVLAYNPATGHLATISTPETTLSYGLDGSLPTSESWSGAVSGSVSSTYDNDFRPASES
jgi:YD repeat-containing protein